MTTVVGLFRRYANAEQAMDDLLANRFAMDEISAVVPESVLKKETSHPASRAGAAADAGNPGILGLGGVISGIKGTVMPGLGTVRSSGPLLADLQKSDVAGGAREAQHSALYRALVARGIPDEHAAAYSAAVEHGGVLLAVDTDERVADAKSVMLANNAADVGSL